MSDTSEHILALAQLQKLVNHATQSEYLKDVEFDHEAIINMLVLEKVHYYVFMAALDMCNSI